MYSKIHRGCYLSGDEFLMCELYYSNVIATLANGTAF